MEVVAPIDTFHFLRGKAREEAIAIAFHCRATGGQLALSPEHDEARWVPIDRLLEVDCPETFRRCFEVLLARRDARP